ncbi:MAG: [protein-PII] uridylyltransferase, partial [Acidobacteria bacterium]|nr:[protein-PII] uridylyltransferase [Acidobacteriota bacterium]
YQTVSEALAVAGQNLIARNALADARLVSGNPYLFKRLSRELEEMMLRRGQETTEYLGAMRREIEQRYARFGRSIGLQEPHVKESAGGLRDLHVMLWMARARYGCTDLDALRMEGLLSATEASAARRGYEFLFRVRNEAHFSTGRKTDVLTLDLQWSMASNLGYRPRRGLLASERFMREYYQHAHALHAVCKSFLARMRAPAMSTRRYILPERRLGREETPFVVRKGRLHWKRGTGDFKHDPMRLWSVFSAAQAAGVDLDEALTSAVRASLAGVDRRFRASAESGREFMRLLGARGQVGAALRVMQETGFLGRYLPEFARIAFLVQHDAYHRYTIDEHTLQAVECMDGLQSSKHRGLGGLSEIWGETGEVSTLYLGLLLHDIGKGRGSDHSTRGARIAARLCARLGLDEAGSERVVFLVRHHLLMSHLSQRWDIGEARLVEQFARRVGSLEVLRMLTLLTYADTSGVGPGVWSDWKGSLLLELYHRTRPLLEAGGTGVVSPRRTHHVRRRVISALTGEARPMDVERHLTMLPDRYLRTTPAEEMVRHYRLIQRLADQPAITDWRAREEEQLTELTVCARDRQGLFARLAGVFTAEGINILSADLYTCEDGWVIDTFKLCEAGRPSSIPSVRWPGIDRCIKSAVEGRYDVVAAVEERRRRAARSLRRRYPAAGNDAAVRFDNESSARNTIVEVRAGDELGLAFKIASRLAALHLSITFARITTEKDLALDVFYVTDAMGRKLRPAGLAVVERSLLDALGAEVRAKGLQKVI